jgi:murein L,D-transpeptidase YafK
MARHRTNPNMAFWRMLKEGYDHFETMKQPPKVDVCDRRYVFNAVAKDNAAFNPTAACPAL